MRSNDLPIIPKEMHLGEAIILVSKGKLGLGVSLDENQKIIGLITDGDIRRAMEKWQAGFVDHTVEDIMTQEAEVRARRHEDYGDSEDYAQEQSPYRAGH